MSASFAARLVDVHCKNQDDQVTLAYRLALGREPTEAELKRAVKVQQEAGLKAVCWALFNSSEFAYVK
jgi:hypothetical protein